MQTYQTDERVGTFWLRDLVGLFRRRRWVIRWTVILFVAVAVCICLATPQTYRCYTEMLVEDLPRQGAVDPSDPMVAFGAQNAGYGMATHILMLESSGFLRQVFEVARIPNPTNLDDAPRGPEIRAEQIADTNVLAVTVDAPNQETARGVANALPQAYSQFIEKKNHGAGERATRIVDDMTMQTRHELTQAVSELAAFDTAHKVVDRTDASVGPAPSSVPVTAVTRDRRALVGRVSELEKALLFLQETALRLRLRNTLLQEPVSRLEEAGPPLAVPPPWGQALWRAIFFGLMFGCLFALVRDKMQDRVNTDRDLRRATGFAVSARLPVLPGWTGKFIWKKRDRRTLDRFRLLCQSLASAIAGPRGSDGQHSGDGAPFGPSTAMPCELPELKSVMVTSAYPTEGKSLVAANLATAMAIDGWRVVLVDAGLRAPSLHKSFEVGQTPGLGEVVLGKAPLDEALQITKIDGLRLLTAGEPPENPVRSLASAEFRELHEKLQSEADVVIYDAGSLCAHAETQALASTVGGVLIVTELGVPRKDDMRDAVASMARSGARILGVVVNKDRDARNLDA